MGYETLYYYLHSKGNSCSKHLQLLLLPSNSRFIGEASKLDKCQYYRSIKCVADELFVVYYSIVI